MPQANPKSPRLHLIANSHIDPMYMWQWTEGISEALATFRAAADIAESNPGYIFNHNEALLYEWVRQLDPDLFSRIQKLHALGRWHIMGGWYLQPDCNLPGGESFVRQILLGVSFFKRHFGVRPTTAMNFDSFGHSRGLVQILRRAGFDSYLFCRPSSDATCPLPADDFIWVGFDGSEILAHRSNEHYNSGFGEAAAKLTAWLEGREPGNPSLFLWGVGNHGGGPSRRDVAELNQLVQSRGDVQIVHSTPEAYFADLAGHEETLSRHCKDLNPVAEGCYTTLSRIKRRHRELENQLLLTEKMLSCAAIQGLIDYPADQLQEATEDLLLSQFHDALAGSMIRHAEIDTLRMMDHGLEILDRLKYRAFYSLGTGERPVGPGESPVLIFNPHPYPVEGIFECEFGLPPDRKALGKLDQLGEGSGRGFTLPVLRCDGKPVPCQLEKEHSHKPWDWRKRIAFRAVLEPFSMNRFDCTYRFVPERPTPKLQPESGRYVFDNGSLKVTINCDTGLMEQLCIDGRSYLAAPALAPLVVDDHYDVYGWSARFDDVVGRFQLMSPQEVAEFTGFRQVAAPSVRVIEQGEARTVIEAMFSFGRSAICMLYKLPQEGTEIEVELRVEWNEKGRMLKVSLPSLLHNAQCIADVAYGAQSLSTGGEEHYAHQWVGLFDDADDTAITCVNDGAYALSCEGGELRLTLLRSPLYLGTDFHPECPPPQDRWYFRTDQGEHVFRFWLNAGPATLRRDAVDREALSHNEAPPVLSMCPSGQGKKPQPLASIDGDAVQMTACKKAHGSDHYIIRLFEPTGRSRSACLRLPAVSAEACLSFEPFEIKTLRIDVRSGELEEVNLIEEALDNDDRHGKARTASAGDPLHNAPARVVRG